MAIRHQELLGLLLGQQALTPLAPHTGMKELRTLLMAIEETGRYLPEAERLERDQARQQLEQEARLISERIIPRYEQLIRAKTAPTGEDLLQAARQAVAELEPQLPTVMFCAPAEIQFSGSGRGKRALTTGEQIAAGIDLERRRGAADNIEALNRLRKRFIVP